MAPVTQTDQDLGEGPPKYTSSGKRREHTELPPSLQRIVTQEDEDESIYDEYWAGEYNEPVPAVRYAAYTSRLRTLTLSLQRYLAYTSNVSESVGPLFNPYMLTGAHAVSWGYILWDAIHESRKASHKIPQLDMDAASAHPRVAALSKDYRLVGIQRILFHSLASMALPAATIQGVMKCTSWMMKDIKNTRLRTTGTLGLGLSVIPFCPYIFDKPVAKALDWAFNKAL